MKKIIKEGKQPEEVVNCKLCSCEFTFEWEDIIKSRYHNEVECPCCGQRNILKYTETTRNPPE